jgi:hypothetical protein
MPKLTSESDSGGENQKIKNNNNSSKFNQGDYLPKERWDCMFFIG